MCIRWLFFTNESQNHIFLKIDFQIGGQRNPTNKKKFGLKRKKLYGLIVQLNCVSYRFGRVQPLILADIGGRGKYPVKTNPLLELPVVEVCDLVSGRNVRDSCENIEVERKYLNDKTIVFLNACGK